MSTTTVLAMSDTSKLGGVYFLILILIFVVFVWLSIKIGTPIHDRMQLRREEDYMRRKLAHAERHHQMLRKILDEDEGQ